MIWTRKKTQRNNLQEWEKVCLEQCELLISLDSSLRWMQGRDQNKLRI